ncbi:MAG: hypothetical protein HC919_03030 [Oscillatoriales cyanobacterium SM2_2_1]|nr:hypothetical protein [Oscillatoriales cyanobacterium SM2_2_1]
MSQSSSSAAKNEVISANLLRFIGYGFLVFALLNFGEALLPPKFAQDPSWEFQAVAKVAGTSAIPILGFGLVFYGEAKMRSPLGRTFVGVLSWLALATGILYVILMVIGISATFRINNDLRTQAERVRSRQSQGVERARNELKNRSDAELLQLLTQISQTAPNLKPDATNPRQQIEQLIEGRGAEVERTIVEQENSSFRSLLKQSLKINLESLISGILLMGIWRFTGWARVGAKKKKRRSQRPAYPGSIVSEETVMSAINVPHIEERDPESEEDES